MKERTVQPCERASPAEQPGPRRPAGLSSDSLDLLARLEPATFWGDTSLVIQARVTRGFMLAAIAGNQINERKPF